MIGGVLPSALIARTWAGPILAQYIANFVGNVYGQSILGRRTGNKGETVGALRGLFKTIRGG